MKQIIIAGMLLIGGWAQASLVSQTFSPGTVVPVANPVGVAFSGTFIAAGAGQTVGSITVGLNVTGGYSGGFYMYLVAPNGSTAVTLFNTPGTATSGVNVTLQDGATAITSGSDLSSGTWAAAGSLSGFNGQTVNGNWTLYFADLASGGGSPTLNSWTLNINAVPEPVNMALALFGLLALGGGGIRFYLRRKKISPAA